MKNSSNINIVCNTDSTYPRVVCTCIIGISKVFYLSCIIHILLFVHKYSFNLSVPKSYSIRNVWKQFWDRKINRHTSLNAKMSLKNAITNIDEHLCRNNEVRTRFFYDIPIINYYCITWLWFLQTYIIIVLLIYINVIIG